ncbi:Na+/H+ antiporter NhaC family protein, partial [Variovorax sp. CT11-76]
MIIGLFITIGIGSSFGTIPIITAIYYPLALELGFSTSAIIILIGIAVSTFFSGSSFALDSNNFVDWQSKFRGLEALKNPFNYILGI